MGRYLGLKWVTFRPPKPVQLKATDQSVSSYKHSCSAEHVKQWEASDLKVLLVKYYKKHNCFYCVWITKSHFKELGKKKNLTIHLDLKVEEGNLDLFKKNIIKHIEPLNITYGPVIPSTKQKNTYKQYIKVENYHDTADLQNAINIIEKKVQNDRNNRHLLKNINEKMKQNPHDLLLYFQKIILCLKLNKDQEAIDVLEKAMDDFESVEPKILLNVIGRHGISYLKALERIQFRMYFMWLQNGPPGIAAEMYAKDDKNNKQLLKFNPAGVLLDEKYLKSVGFEMIFPSHNGNKPVSCSQMCLYLVLLDIDGKPMLDFKELIKKY